MLHIFTDGACSGNGQKGAKAAFSVVLWNLPDSQEPIGIAEKVPDDEPQTNQRAELRGLARAFIEIHQRGLKGPITIWTDSDYGRKCITEWGPVWKARGWRRTNQPRKPIEHLDILQVMVEWYEQNQHYVRIQHVAAHTNKQVFPYTGNALADSLATGALVEKPAQKSINE
jgi:ribonuclease HI